MGRHSRDEPPRRVHRLERDADDLLAGRVATDARRLLTLIHEVNPTGRSLGRGEAQARYALKVRLQSLLVRRFRDDLCVERDADASHTVSLRHRRLRVDGCHAIVADLDDDARAWVQWQLDTEEAGDAPTASDATDRRPDAASANALSLGRAALGAFDYEAARGHLERALDEAPLAAAPLLMELLVDLLGDDEAALLVAERLDAEALRRVDVRARVGMARARCGQWQEAEAIAASLPAPRAAEVHVALGRVAMRDRDVASLRAALDAARRADATRPELASLVEGLARLEAHERGEIEEALQRSVETGDREEIEAAARAILARWPDSEPARRALRELRERGHAEARARHVHDAARALEADNLGAARDALDAAAALGADVGALEARLAIALTAARARAERERVERVRDALRQAVNERSLGEYLELDEVLRARVRVEAPFEALTRIEEVLAGAPWARPSACIAAVVALGSAIEAAARGDFGPAAALHAHEKLLARCASAVALGQRLAHARREELREVNEAMLAEAAGAASAGDVVGARRALDRVEQRALRDDQARRFESVRARISHVGVVSARAARLARCESEGALLVAREHARWLAANADEAERTHWLEVERGLVARGRASARVWAHDDGSPDGVFASSLAARGGSEGWLDRSGRELIVLAGLHDWLIVDRIDVATGRSLGCTSLRLPTVIGTFSAVVTDGAVIAALDVGFTLELDRATWDVVAWRADEDAIGRGVKVTERYLSADGEQVWFQTTSERRGSATVIVDRRSWAVLREIPLVRWIQAIEGPCRGMALHDSRSRRGQVLDATGGLITALDPPVARRFCNVVEHPCGRGFLALGVGARREDAKGRSLMFCAITPDGTFHDVACLAPRSVDDGLVMASSTEAGCVFIVFDTPGAERYLVAVDCTGDEPEERYRIAVPLATHLMCDMEGTRVVAVADGFGRLDVIPLGRDLPRRLRGRVSDRKRFAAPDAAPPFACQAPEGGLGLDPVARKNIEVLVRATPEARRTAVARMARSAESAVTLVDLIRMMAIGDMHADAMEVANMALHHLPRHPLLATVRAELFAWYEQWDASLAALASADQEQLPIHAWHVAGSVHALLGDAEAARAAWRRGIGNIPNDCDLASCLTLVDEASVDDDREAPDTRGEIIRAAVAAARLADACLARGDHEGAIAALACPTTWLCADAQLYARLAFACLERPATTAREALLRRCVFAGLVATCGVAKPSMIGDLIVAGAVWDVPRILAVRDRAKAWLDSEEEWRRWAESGPR